MDQPRQRRNGGDQHDQSGHGGGEQMIFSAHLHGHGAAFACTGQQALPVKGEHQQRAIGQKARRDGSFHGTEHDAYRQRDHQLCRQIDTYAGNGDVEGELLSGRPTGDGKTGEKQRAQRERRKQALPHRAPRQQQKACRHQRGAHGKGGGQPCPSPDEQAGAACGRIQPCQQHSGPRFKPCRRSKQNEGRGDQRQHQDQLAFACISLHAPPPFSSTCSMTMLPIVRRRASCSCSAGLS